MSDSKGGFPVASPRVSFLAQSQHTSWSIQVLYLETPAAPGTWLGHWQGMLGHRAVAEVGLSLGYYRLTGFLQGHF